MNRQNYRIRHRVNDIFRKMDDHTCHEDNSNKINTGCYAIDSKTDGGLFKRELTILGGRPAMGLSLLALNMIDNACACGKKTILFTGYSGNMMTKRLLAMASGISFPKIMENDLEWDEKRELKRAARSVAAYPLIIDDQTCMNLSEIKKRARSVKKNEGLDFIVIDYLQAISVVKWWFQPKNAAYTYVYICKELEKLARELDVAILLITWLSDKLDKRSFKRPLLKDFDMYGPITSYANLILTLYRDTYYYHDGDKAAEIGIQKAKRDNPVCHIVKLETDLANSRFYYGYNGFMPIPIDFDGKLPFS